MFVYLKLIKNNKIPNNNTRNKSKTTKPIFAIFFFKIFNRISRKKLGGLNAWFLIFNLVAWKLQSTIGSAIYYTFIMLYKLFLITVNCYSFIWSVRELYPPKTEKAYYNITCYNIHIIYTVGNRGILYYHCSIFIWPTLDECP